MFADTYLDSLIIVEILASQAGFKDCARLIRFKAPEIVYVNAGEEILGSRVIGITPIPIGVDSKRNCLFHIPNRVMVLQL